MPSNPTTLAELVSMLERESDAARQRATLYRTYDTSNSASDYEAFKADLMERAAKVLRAVDELLVGERRRNELVTSRTTWARTIAAARLGLINAIDVVINRALGGSDGG